MKEKIDLKQQRDVGEVLSATFSFIRQEFVGLMGAIVIYAGPLILMYAIASAFMQVQMQERIQDYVQNLSFNIDPMVLLQMYPIKTTLITVILAFTAMIVSTAITFAYIQNYIEKGPGEFSRNDVWETARDKMLGYVILTASLFFAAILASMAIGALAFINPGFGGMVGFFGFIYLGIATSLIYVVKAYEACSSTECFSRSFWLIRGNWWRTLGLYLIISIVVFAFAMAIETIGRAIGITNVLTNNGFDSLDKLKNTKIVFSAIAGLMTYFFYIVYYIAQSLYYFSLVSDKENPDLEDRIKQIND